MTASNALRDDWFASRRFMVTGGAGFLGQQIVAGLRARGTTEIFVPRSAQYDLRERPAVEAALEAARPDVVIHGAAMVGGIGANREHPGSYFYANAIMGLHLIEAARLRGIEKMVVVGTVCSYPKFCPTPFHEEDLWDGYPEETNAPYGLAKKMLLAQLQAYEQEYGTRGVFLMPANLYGPGDNFDPSNSHVIPALIRKMVMAQEAGDAEVEVWGSGNASREFLHVRDAAEGVLLATERYESVDPVNLGTGAEITIRDLVTAIQEAVGFTGSVHWDPSMPDGQPRRRLDTSRAEERFGFHAQVPLDAGLAETVAWYRERRPDLVRS